MKRTDKILIALTNAKRDGKLDIVSAVSGVTIDRLEDIIKSKSMTTMEESILSLGL